MRAVIRAGSLTLLPAELANVSGGPMGCLARAALDSDVAIADLDVGDEPEDVDEETAEAELGGETLATEPAGVEEDREVEVRFLANDTPGARRTLRRWAARVGHRRIWFRDQVVDVEPPAELDGEFATTCPTCDLEITDSGPELTKFVHSVGYFPMSCFVCGAFVPQWEPVPPEPMERQAAAGRRPGHDAEHRLRVVDA
jgi:hypothetical protein